jgi:hypothetical protein
MRVEVLYRPEYPDGRAKRLLTSMRRSVSPSIRGVRMVDVFIIDGVPDLGPDIAREVFCDPVAQLVSVGSNARRLRESGACSWR